MGFLMWGGALAFGLWRIRLLPWGAALLVVWALFWGVISTAGAIANDEATADQITFDSIGHALLVNLVIVAVFYGIGRGIARLKSRKGGEAETR